MRVCMCAVCMPVTLGGYERTSDSLYLELLAVLSHHRVLGTKLSPLHE